MRWPTAFALVCGFAFFCAIPLFVGLGERAQSDAPEPCRHCVQLEIEAVQHHAAEWYVDEDGERQFRWIEREPEEAAETPRVR